MPTKTRPTPPTKPKQAVRGWTPWTLQPDGTIEFTVADRTYELGAPTIGQLERVELAHAKANSKVLASIRVLNGQVAAVLEDDAAVEQADPVVLMEGKYERVGYWRDWWQLVFTELLSGDPPPLDGLPPWMLGPDKIIEALGHWQSVPSDPGGQP